MTKRSVIQQIEKLESAGLVEVYRSTKDGIKQSNKYKLNIINSEPRSLHSESRSLHSESRSLHSESRSLGVVNDVHHRSESRSLGVVNDVHIKQSIETINETVILNTHTATPKKPLEQKTARACEKKEIVLSEEQSACLAWALTQEFWAKQITTDSKFLTLYNNGSPRGVKNQYEEVLQAQNLQAQKSPLEANQAGLITNHQQNGVTPYANNNTANRKLSTADRQRYAAIRGEYYERYQCGLIDEQEYQRGIQQYATH
jgi:hypothetical protein